MRTFYDIAMSWGVLSPNLRLEYRHAVEGGYAQSMFYTNLGPAQTYAINQGALALELINATIGLRARAGAALAVDVEYGTMIAAKSFDARTFRASARFAY